MPLSKKNISIPFALGLNQKTGDASSEVGTLRDCKNIQIDKLGEIKKRHGFVSQVQSGSNSTPFDSVNPIRGKRLTSLNNSALMLDGLRGYSAIAGTTKYKDVGKILATQLEQENIHEANEAKVSPIAFKRITVTYGVLDVYLWTETVPFTAGENLGATYKSFIEIRDQDSGVRVSPIIELVSQSRETTHGSSFNSELEYLTMAPQPQMLFSSTTDHLYFFYYGGSGSRNIIKRTMDLSGASPSFTLSSPSNFITLVNPSVGTFACDSYNDTQTMYFAYYRSQTSSTDDPGDLNLAQILEAGADNLVVINTVQVTNSVYATTDSQRSDLATKTGCRVNIALRALNTSANFNVFIAYSVQNSGKGGSNEYRTFLDFFKPDLSNSLFTQTSLPDGLAFSVNSRHAILNSATAGVKSGTGSSVVYSVALEICSDQGQSLINTLKGSVTPSVATTTQYKTGLANLAASTAVTPSFGEVPAQVIIGASSGSVSASVVDIIHPGNQFSASTNAITQGVATGSTAPVASGNIESDVSQIDLIKPDHGIFFLEINSDSLPSGVQDITSFTYKDASLVSDMMHHHFTGTTDFHPYFAISKTLGNSSSSSGNTYIADGDGDIVATFLTGNQSLNFTSEIRSRIINKFSLMSGLSRIHSQAEDSNTRSEFLFGANEFVGDEDVSGDLGQTLGSTLSTDQKFRGVLYSFKTAVFREYPTQEVGLKTYIGGGSLFVFDGARITENNFWEFPQIRHLKASAQLTGASGSQSVTYAFVFSAVDNAGDLHESATVLSDVIAKGSSQSICGQIYITDSTLRSLTSGGSDRPQLDIYRTEDNGSVFFKIQSISFNETDRFLTFVDDFNNTIDKERLLYTTGGVADNQTTGSISDLALYKNRVMATSVAGDNLVLASRPLEQGFSCGFPLIAPFQILIQDQSEKITGIEKMPDFFLCFSQSNVYAVFGDGPNEAGIGAFTGPKNIGPNQGMVEGTPHLSTSLGVFYISERGLYLVTSNTQIGYLGASIEDAFIENSVTAASPFPRIPVKSIILDDESNEIRLLMEKNSAVLIYNTYFNTWYEWEIATGNTTNQKLVDHKIINGSYLVLQENGSILRSDNLDVSAIGYVDNYINAAGSAASSFITMEVQLHGISANGIQGAQRVYRAQVLGDFKSSHNLSMTVFNDFSSSAAETHTVGVSSDTGPYLFRAHLSNQKSRSMSLKLTLTGNGEAAILRGVGFEVGLRPGTFKLPAAQTIQEV